MAIESDYPNHKSPLRRNSAVSSLNYTLTHPIQIVAIKISNLNSPPKKC